MSKNTRHGERIWIKEDEDATLHEWGPQGYACLMYDSQTGDDPAILYLRDDERLSLARALITGVVAKPEHDQIKRASGVIAAIPAFKALIDIGVEPMVILAELEKLAEEYRAEFGFVNQYDKEDGQ